MQQSHLTAAFLACAFSKVLAAPAPIPDSGIDPEPICTDSKSYSISSQWAFLAPPKREAGESCVAGSAGCSLSATFEHSVAITVDFGASLGLDFKDIFDAGIDASVSVTTENSESVTVQENCPPGCECGIQSVAHMHHVQGNQTTTPSESDCVGGTTSAFYSVDYPVTDPSAPANNQLVATWSACAIGTCNPIGGGPVPPPCP